jgi:hypothetical protein
MWSQPLDNQSPLQYNLTMDATRESLNAAINEFLKERRESKGGGWAAIEPEDIDQLHEILARLVLLRCAEDADGDLPIEWNLIDRRRYEPMHFDAVPYSHGIENRQRSAEAFEAHYSKVSLNLQVALTAFSTAESLRRSLNLKFLIPDKVKVAS